MIEKIKSFAKNRNNLFAVVLAGILLMVIALPVDSGRNRAETQENVQTTDAEAIGITDSANEITGVSIDAETEQYVTSMEQKVEELLCGMDGAGKVKVIITLQTSVEKIVEKDMPVARSNTVEEDSQGGTRSVNTMDSDEKTIYSTEGSTSVPYVVKTVSPKVEGVLVLAEGAGNGTVSKNLSDAIQVLFGIEAHQVKIIKMKSAK